jgi:general secretion pathway protein I
MTAVRQREAEICMYPSADAARRPWPLHGPLPSRSRWVYMLRRWMIGAKREAGFTLVEVIVALAILSAGLGLLLGLISNSLRQTASAQRMAGAGSLAQSLMAEVGTDLPIRAEVRDGQYLNGYRWHLKMQPYDSARDNEDRPVGLYSISAEVEWEEGAGRRFYALTTLRLGPRATRQ